MRQEKRRRIVASEFVCACVSLLVFLTWATLSGYTAPLPRYFPPGRANSPPTSPQEQSSHGLVAQGALTIPTNEPMSLIHPSFQLAQADVASLSITSLPGPQDTRSLHSDRKVGDGPLMPRVVRGMRWVMVMALVVLTDSQMDIRNVRAESEEEVAFFESRIRPVLVERCYACHSAGAAAEQKLQGGLQVDSRDGLLQGGDLGPAIVPGQPGESLLIQALRHESGLEMPPEGRLPAQVIADFERWIEMGAPDPRSAPDDASPLSEMDFASRSAAAKSHWAFLAPQTHPLPPVSNGDWPQVELDYFVLARLDQLGLQPVTPANRAELLRRITLSLIGLPPTFEEVEAFVADDSPQAIDHVLDRLLASPHYGERWGRFWLDVARYADDKALAYHNPWPHAHRYRDWVVNALNRDLPYDQFLALQLAADLLPEYSEEYSERAALGFQGLGAIYHKGNFPKQVMADELDDRIDTLTRGLLGLTVACARCHDHKYDPVATADYYSLAAAYNEAKWVELPLASPEVVETRQSWEAERKRKEEARQAWLAQARLDIGRRELGQLEQYLLAAWRGDKLADDSGDNSGDNEPSAPDTDLEALFVQRIGALIDEADLEMLSSPLAQWVRTARTVRSTTFDNSANGNMSNGDAANGSTDVDTAAERTAKDGRSEEAPLPPSIVAATRELVVTFDHVLAKHDRQQADASEATPPPDTAAPSSSEEALSDELPDELSESETQLLQQLWLAETALFHVPEKQVTELLDGTQRKQLGALSEALVRHDATAPLDPPRAHGVVGGGSALRVHIRGNVERLGDETPPGFLPVLAMPQTVGRDGGSTFTRLELARAICTSDNPLTARVIVNRVWQQHFGEGIVKTTSNFGLLGSPPTHPELLDTLTVRFIESGWSLKWLHREILRSSAYQLSSRGAQAIDGSATGTHRELDPSNRFLWRFSARRMDFESLRDSLLAVSGQLDRTLGGPAVGRAEEGHLRRTIYSTISRRVPDKMLVTFDFPDPNVTAEGRSMTTVPQQQLFALNSDFMFEAAQALARRSAMAIDVNGAGDLEQARIQLLYKWVLSREPTATELEMAREFVESAAGWETVEDVKALSENSQVAFGDSHDVWVQLAHALLATNEFIWID